MESDVVESVFANDATRSIATRFEIPTRDEDLLLPSDDMYFVSIGDHPLEFCIADLEACADRIYNMNWVAVRDHFDTFYTICRSTTALDDWDLRMSAARRLIEAFDALCPAIQECIDAAACTTSAGLSKTLAENCDIASDVLLMIVYLFHKLVCLFEPELIDRQQSANVPTTAPGKGRKQKNTGHDGLAKDWLSIRAKIVSRLGKICEFSTMKSTTQGAIRLLWKTREPNKGMMRVFMELIFKFFDNPECGRSSGRPWLTDLCKLAVTICAKFNFYDRLAFPFIEKTFHLNYILEQTTVCYPFVEAIKSAGTPKDTDPLLANMILYVCQLGKREFHEARTTTAARPYSYFLQVIAEKAPHVTIKHIGSINQYLDSDPYSLRSAVLATFAELLCSSVLSDEACKTSQRSATVRDGLLKKLRDHLMDSNATVRTRVVNLWTKLATCRRIPLSCFEQGLLTMLGQRLSDKSVLVRRAAVQFMSTFLSHNPYGHDFSFDMNREKIASLLKKQEEMNSKRKPVAGPGRHFEAFNGLLERLLDSLSRSVAEIQVHGDRAGYAEMPRKKVVEIVNTSMSQLTLDVDTACDVFVGLAYVGRIKGDDGQVDFTWDQEKIVEGVVHMMRQRFIKMRMSEVVSADGDMVEEEQDNEDFDEEITRIDYSIDFLKNKLLIELELEKCVPLALRAVTMGDISEMREGIRFVVECKNFMIRGADAAVRKMCSLIWKKEADIRKEVLEAANKMFISRNQQETIQAESTANNLLNVVEGMSEVERCCVEEVICLMATATKFPDGVLKRIWRVLTDDRYPDKQLVALRLVGILAQAERENLYPHIRKLQEIVRDGVRKHGEADSRKLAIEALLAMSNLSTPPVSMTTESICDEVFRIPCTDSLFSTLEQFFFQEFFRVEDTVSNDEKAPPMWYRSFQAILNIYYYVAKDTAFLTSRLASKAMSHVHSVSKTLYFCRTELARRDLTDNERKILKLRKQHFLALFLRVNERMLALAGEIALRTVIHVDTTFVYEFKRMAEVMEMNKKGELEAVDASPRWLQDWEWKCAMRKRVFGFRDDTSQENRMSEDERIQSRASEVLNHRILRNGTLLNRLLAFVLYTLRAPHSPPVLRDSAAMAFSKFMLISGKTAERGALLFFNLLNNYPSSQVRSNLMIAAADLAIRFPNTSERHSVDLTSMVKDEENAVRETSILVLNYLVTNDMIKVRGSLAECARCYLDPVPTVRILAEQFFTELAKKGPIIGNLLIDFVSLLSSTVTLEEFVSFMKFLFGLMKDKQIDYALDKICQRFEHAKNKDSLKLAVYLSNCVEMLPISERSLPKLTKTLDLYAMFLTDHRVYNCFHNALQLYLKGTRTPEQRAEAEEFDSQILKIHTKGMDKDAVIAKYEAIRKAKEKPVRGATRGRTASTRKPVAVPPKARAAAGGGSGRPAAARRIILSDSDSDSD